MTSHQNSTLHTIFRKAITPKRFGVSSILSFAKRGAVLPTVLMLFSLNTVPLHAQSDKSESRGNRDVGSEEWYLRTEDKAAELYVREVGQGDPVVVLHGGWGAEHSYLLNAIKGLETRFRFIFYDQRGSLRSPCKLEFISEEKHVQDLETLRKELKLEKLTIFAHSNGTRLAMLYLQKYPERVKTLVLAGALPAQSGSYLPAGLQSAQKEANAAFSRFIERPEVHTAYLKAGLDIEKQRTSAKPLENKSAKQMMELWRISFAAGNLYDLKHLKEVTANNRFWNEEAANAATKTSTRDNDFVPLLARHPYPVTVINGDHDLAEFGNWYYSSKEFRAAAPKVEVVILKNAGHIMWIDDPAGFRKSLKKGLSKQWQ
jgi:proline iminopeptidase